MTVNLDFSDKYVAAECDLVGTGLSDGFPPGGVDAHDVS
jgi:hypothetical protein